MKNESLWPSRILTAAKFSAIIGVSYWAVTMYEKAFALDGWYWGIVAFFIVFGVMLLFGKSLLDVMHKD